VYKIAIALTSLLLAVAPVSAQRFGPRQVDSLPSRSPSAVARYGTDSLHFGELRLPDGNGPFPVAVVIHGGCWTKGFATLRNTAALASALVDLGVATWNIEYRQLRDPGGGWPGTFQDVGAGIDYLRTLARQHPLDLRKVVLIGHSAGAHLALWGAGRGKLAVDSPIRGQDPLTVHGAVAIDGPGDLIGFVGLDQRICGQPVITNLFGGSPTDQPERYRQGSPQELLPLRVPQYLVAAPVLTADAARAYQARARAVGDTVAILVVTDGGHFDVIGPGRPAFAAVRALLAQAFGMERR
jgi:acetyl esterase/lipase